MTASPTTRSWLQPGAIFQLFRAHGEDGLSKRELVDITGLSRSAVTQRVDLLVGAGYLEPVGPDATSARGRPAERFMVDLAHGVILIADTGATGMRTAVADPAGNVLAEMFEVIDIADGPAILLDLMVRRFDDHLGSLGIDGSAALGIGISVPGPVATDRGRVLSPPIMPGWHDYDIPAHLGRTFDCPVVVENDANAMAVGEHRSREGGSEGLVFVKLGTGIGTGLVIGGQLLRGADGTAGDLGHVPVLEPEDERSPRCRCGRRGCLEALASGWAVLRDLRAGGLECTGIDDLVRLVRHGDERAVASVVAASRAIGAALSDLVYLLNPRHVVFGGQLSELDDVILAQVREAVYRRSPPLSTRRLEISTSTHPDPGVIGLAALVSDHVFAPDRIDARLA